MSWFVYVLLNEARVTYTGISDDPGKRLAAHNAGKGAKFTRGRGPWAIAHLEEFEAKGAALSREAALKKDRGFKKRLKALWRDRRTP
ncbi:MAG: GIY-YIG nuclease family protein [Tagaea sp.]